MKWLLVRLALIGFAMLMFFTGNAEMTGYYSDPDGYGFHDIQEANFQVSMAFLILSSVTLAYAARKLQNAFM
ncbi:MAG: hypothetical protein J7K54_01480 [Candidatus Aenigmarchaeota archaeon]|nr:hypothetical protein [Candidatus Aenigmarchaeota archaeon]